MILIESPQQHTAVSRDERVMATWHLQRHRKISTGTPAQQKHVQDCIARSGVRPSGFFSFHNWRTAIRPTAAALVRCLWQANGQPVSLNDVCQTIYGRPATMRAVRLIAFRANRAFERVNCPLTICCHAGMVFVRERVRMFQLAGDAVIDRTAN